MAQLDPKESCSHWFYIAISFTLLALYMTFGPDPQMFAHG